MALLITDKIGKNWIKNLEEIKQLERFIDDPEFRHNWSHIKYENKQYLAAYIEAKTGVLVNPNSLFDIQVISVISYQLSVISNLWLNPEA